MATHLQQLTIPADSYPSPVPAAVSSPFESAEGVVPLSHYLWVVRKQAWKIGALVISSIILTFVISSRLQPVYESTSTISIDREAPNALVGDNARQQVASTQDADHYIATQIKIIQSDCTSSGSAEIRSVKPRRPLQEIEPGTCSGANR